MGEHGLLPLNQSLVRTADFCIMYSISVVESGVAKHTSEDTQDSGGLSCQRVPEESVPNKDPEVSERSSFITPTT